MQPPSPTRSTEVPGDPTCICQGTGLTTRLTETGNTGPEICECVARKARNQEHQRLKEALEKAFDTHARWAQEDAEAHRVRGRHEAALLASERERTYRVLVTSVGDILDGKRPLRALLDTLHPSGERQTDQEALAGLPPDLAAALQEPGVFVPQDSAVFRMLAEWNNAPSNTVSAELPPSGEQGEEAQGHDFKLAEQCPTCGQAIPDPDTAWPVVYVTRRKTASKEIGTPGYFNAYSLSAEPPNWPAFESRLYTPATDPSKEERNA